LPSLNAINGLNDRSDRSDPCLYTGVIAAAEIVAIGALSVVVVLAVPRLAEAAAVLVVLPLLFLGVLLEAFEEGGHSFVKGLSISFTSNCTRLHFRVPPTLDTLWPRACNVGKGALPNTLHLRAWCLQTH
jgi:hypothetical protein